MNFGLLLIVVIALAKFTDVNGIDGFDTKIEKNKWLVSVAYQNQHICVGSIISVNRVITAAQCTQGRTVSSLKIRAGSNSTRTGGVFINVASICQNPNFSSSTKQHDISVLRLASKLAFNDITIGSIPLPPSSSTYPPDKSGYGYITGFGDISYESKTPPQIVRSAWIPLVSQTECAGAYGSSRFLTGMFCAGYSQGTVEDCQGDKGSPLTSNHKLFGIISWGYNCTERSYNAVYTWIPNYISFINQCA